MRSEMTIDQATPMEYFKEVIDSAISRQRLDSTAESAYYLTQLLDRFVRPNRIYSEAGVAPDQTLAELYCHALGSTGRRRFLLLRLTGDVALFVSGFFSESLERQLVSAQYYRRLGGRAYGTLSDEHRLLNELYAELAEKFDQFVDVLNDVGESCSLADDRDVLRLYERWQETGSRRSAEILRDKGIHVVPSSDAVH